MATGGNLRDSEIVEFLTRAGWGEAARTPLTADASTRRYERLRRKTQTAMLMDAPPLESVPCPPDATDEERIKLGWNAVSRLAGIAADRRWEVIFLTRRTPSAGDIVQVQSQRWLEAKGFTLPCVYVTPGSRGRIAAALHLDLVIDASPDNCVSVVTESDARAILVWPGDRSSLSPDARRPEISITKSFGECLDALSAVDEPSSQDAGVFAWVRRLFGLRQARQA